MMEIKQFTVNFFGENCYLLYDETKEAVLIDCGCMNRQEFSQVEGFITQQQLVLKHHLCTHYHVDHLMGAALVYQQYGLLPEVCQKDTDVLPPVGQQAMMFGLPNIQETAIGIYLNEGDVIHFGHTKLDVIAVPGHSPGSVAFYQKERGCVFVGDALFAGSIGRTDLWGGDAHELIRSIHQALFTLPDSTVVYPGHGPETTIAYEKSNNPYL